MIDAKARVLSAGVLAIGLLSPLSAYAHDAGAEAAILRIEKGFTTAKTTEAATKDFAPSIVLYDMMPPVFRDFAAARAHVGALFSTAKNFKIDILDINVDADAELGFAYSTQHLVMEGGKGLPDVDIVYRVTDCYRKIGGRWLVVSQHISIPVDLTTGKAVFHSK